MLIMYWKGLEVGQFDIIPYPDRGIIAGLLCNVRSVGFLGVHIYRANLGVLDQALRYD